MINAARTEEELLSIQFIFCDYLKPKEVICHCNQRQICLTVSDLLKDAPTELAKIEDQILKKLRH